MPTLQTQSNNELDSLYRQHSTNINLLTNSMDSVMANLPKINLLESPTVEDSDTERLDVVMVSTCYIELASPIVAVLIGRS